MPYRKPNRKRDLYRQERSAFSSLYKIILFLIVVVFLWGYFARRGSSLSRVEKTYDKVSRQYERLIEKSPQDLKLKINLAGFYYKFNDYQKVKDLLSAVDVKPAKIILAKSLAKLKQDDYAIELFSQLGDAVKDNEYLYLYGRILENKKLFPKAREIYAKVRDEYKSLALDRISAIKNKIEEGLPQEILSLYQEARDFLAQVQGEAGISLSVDEEMTINPDNTSVSTVHVIEQVLEERGKSLGEIELGYDSTYERIELEFARTINLEGKIIYAGEENIRDVSRYLNFPLYSNAKAFIISMPSVEVGSFIEYKVRIYSSKLVNEDDFNFIYRLRERNPILKADFRLFVPEGRKVNFKFFNDEYSVDHDLAPVFQEEGNRGIYSWHLRNIKPLIPEYNMPPASYVNPAISVSSFSSWDEIYKWWYSLYYDKFKLDKETKNFINVLIKGAEDDLEKAKRIYEFCARNVRYVGVEYGESGYEPHFAEEVFVNRYGDCKDQAILLTAMLKYAGLKAYPALIPTREVYPIEEDFPAINFNHAISVLENQGELIFMDPTAETTSFLNLPLSDQQRLVMVFKDDTWQLADTPRIVQNSISYSMHITLNEQENALIEREVSTKGFFTSFYRGYLKYTHPSIIEEDIQNNIVQISPFAKLGDYEIENIDSMDKDPVLRYKFSADKFLNPAGSLRVLPALNEVFIEADVIGKQERNFALDFEGLFTKKVEISVNLPYNLKLKHQPQGRDIENKWFKLSSAYDVTQDAVKITREFSLKERFVEKEEYAEFKKEVENMLYFLREEIVLDVLTGPALPADVGGTIKS